MAQSRLLSLGAIAGLVLAIVAVVRDYSPPEAQAASATQPVSSPFAASVAGAGIIEASSENIAVGTPVPGIVTAVHVKPGSSVKTGDPLFRIDDRDLRGQLLPAHAEAREAEARLAKAQNLLRIAEHVRSRDNSAVSKEDLDNRRFDVSIATAAVASAQARIERLKVELERRTVRALAAGKILQVKIRPGEFATAGVSDPPLMLLGGDSRLHVRVDVDENAAGRIRPGAPAAGFARGSPSTRIPLKFERIEPYVVPKVPLTGFGTERVDTRVLQVIYSFEPGQIPVYAGEQMDVFIQATSGQAP